MVAGVAIATGWPLASVWDLTPRQLGAVARAQAAREARQALMLLSVIHAKDPARARRDLQARAEAAEGPRAIPAAERPAGSFSGAAADLFRVLGRPEVADRVERRDRAASLLERFTVEALMGRVAHG